MDPGVLCTSAPLSFHLLRLDLALASIIFKRVQLPTRPSLTVHCESRVNVSRPLTSNRGDMLVIVTDI